MNSVFRTVLFWGTLALAGLLVVALALGRATPIQVILGAAALVYAAVGRVLTTRLPSNAVGWIIASIAVVLMLGALTDGYLDSAPVGDPLLVLQLAGWLSQLVWFVGLFGLVGIALPLVFPDGRPPSRRWRWVAWAGAGGALTNALAITLTPGAMEVPGDVENAFGVAGIGALLSVANGLAAVLTCSGILGAGAAVIVRLRRSRGVERQQVKWFAYVASMIVAGLMVAIATSLVEETAWTRVVGPVAWFAALGMVAIGIPVSTGLAVLRYRLYEIDPVINRTLVYGGLTAALGGAYLASVLVLQFVLSPSSDLAIAGSTLAVAALFRPLRWRIQRLVDRRFYRRRYDAARTIETFGARARDEVSLEALSDELRAVVSNTMQPAHISLWLKETAR